MALTRVQASTKATANLAASISWTIPTPTIGNGLIVFASMWRDSPYTAVPSTCSDNRGNPYALALARGVSSDNPVTSVFYCPAVTSAVAPVTLTVASAPALTSSYWQALAVEISGVGTGLMVDQTVSAQGFAPPITGATAPLTGTESVQAAIHAIRAIHGALTVVAATPVWREEFEDLTNNQIAGEADTRIVSASAGTTPSCSWTGATPSASWAAVLVAFTAGAPAAVATAQPYVWGPL